MPAHKSILLKAEVRKAGRRCHCKHSKKHVMAKGETRFVVKEPGPAMPERGYCAECAKEMIAQAQARLDELRAALGKEG